MPTKSIGIFSNLFTDAKKKHWFPLDEMERDSGKPNPPVVDCTTDTVPPSPTTLPPGRQEMQSRFHLISLI
jgi:hypothetical protein